MLFKAGKSVTDQHREMIYGLLKQIDAQQVMMGRLARAAIDVINARNSDDLYPAMPRLKQVLEEIAKAGGE